MFKKLFLGLIIINGLQSLYSAAPARNVVQKTRNFFRTLASPYLDFPTKAVCPSLEKAIKELGEGKGLDIFSVRSVGREIFPYAAAISYAPRVGKILLGPEFFKNSNLDGKLTPLQTAIIKHELSHISHHDSGFLDACAQLKSITPWVLGWLTQVATSETLTALEVAFFARWGIKQVECLFMRKKEFRADREASQHFTDEEYKAYIKLLEEAKSDHPNWASRLTLLVPQLHPTPAQRIRALKKLKQKKC